MTIEKQNVRIIDDIDNKIVKIASEMNEMMIGLSYEEVMTINLSLAINSISFICKNNRSQALHLCKFFTDNLENIIKDKFKQN